jgi:hypothetical protein
MTLALFELAAQYRQLLELAGCEEIPPEIIRDTLDGLTGELDAKAINVAKFILSLEAQAQAVSEAATSMAARAQRIQNRAESIRAYLLFQLQSSKKLKIEAPELIVAVRKNPPALGLREDAKIPAMFMKTPEPAPPPQPYPDKRAILKALQAGQKIEGAWIKQGQRLEIDV